MQSTYRLLTYRAQQGWPNGRFRSTSRLYQWTGCIRLGVDIWHFVTVCVLHTSIVTEDSDSPAIVVITIETIAFSARVDTIFRKTFSRSIITRKSSLAIPDVRIISTRAYKSIVYYDTWFAQTVQYYTQQRRYRTNVTGRCKYVTRPRVVDLGFENLHVPFARRLLVVQVSDAPPRQVERPRSTARRTGTGVRQPGRLGPGPYARDRAAARRLTAVSPAGGTSAGTKDASPRWSCATRRWCTPSWSGTSVRSPTGRRTTYRSPTTSCTIICSTCGATDGSRSGRGWARSSLPPNSSRCWRTLTIASRDS